MAVRVPAGERIKPMTVAGRRGGLSWKALAVALLLLFTAIPIGAATALLFSYEHQEAIYPGVRAGFIDLGRLTPKAAAARLERTLLEPDEFVLYVAGEPQRIPLSELGAELDAGAT